MKLHTFQVEVLAESDTTEAKSVAFALALACANYGIVIQSVRPIGFRSVPTIEAESGEVSDD